MGLGNVLINAVWRLGEIAVLAAIYEYLAPWHLPGDQVYTYVLLFFADDLAFYWYHRVHHEVRFFWAQHVVHHSSRHFNLSTALRQPWVLPALLPFLAPLAFNTPSHHRVHHGSNPQYLDRNYGGVLIIWDRLFGSFEPEGERVVYGLTKNLHSFNPLRVFSHEWIAIWRDVRGADNWRDRFGYTLRGPGWLPAAEADRRELQREHGAEPAQPQ